MNQNEEVPDFLGGLGDLLPADVLKLVNELLEQLHRKEKDHQGRWIMWIRRTSMGTLVPNRKRRRKKNIRPPYPLCYVLNRQ